MREQGTGKFLKGSQLGKKTQFKKGHKPWNTGLKGVMSINSGSFKPEPIGTITTRKNNGYEYQYIKTISGWKRYLPNGKTKKLSYMKDQTRALKKLFEIPGEIMEVKNLTSKIKEVKIAAPKPIKKTPEQIKRDQQEKEFLAQFGFTGNTISIPIKHEGTK